MKPPRSILDPAFAYRNSANTDVAATFRRIRRELRKAKPPETPRVVQMKRSA